MKHCAPIDSENHKIFRQLASGAGFDERVVREFLWLLNAHDQLISFVQICRNLSEILDAIRGLPDVSLEDYQISAWPALTRWVVDNRDHLVAADPSGDIDRQPNGPGHHPIFRRGVTRHGLYAALWSRHASEELQQDFARVIGHLLLAHIRLMRDCVPLEDYERYGEQDELPELPCSPYPGSLCIRVLSELAAEPALHLLNPEVSPRQFVEQLSSGFSRPELKQRLHGLVDSATDLNSLINSLSNFAALITKIDRGEYGRKRSGGGGGGGSRQWHRGHIYLGGGYQAHSVETGDADDPDSHWNSMTVIQEPANGHEQDIERMLRGIDDDDIDIVDVEGDDEVAFATVGAEEARRGVAGAAYAARGQARHIAMANQLFPWQYENPTVAEVGQLVGFLKHRFDQLPSQNSWSPDDQLVAEAIALIHVMLWTASTLERARSLRLITDHSHESELGIRRCLHADSTSHSSGSESWEWRIRGYVPKYRREVRVKPELVRARIPYVHLPDLLGGIGFLKPLMAADESNRSIFPRRNLKTHRDAIKRLLAEVDPTGRWTIGKIGQFLFHRLIALDGDVTEAAIMTGRSHRLVQSRVFYTTPSVKNLRTRYCRAVMDVVNHMDVPSAAVDSIDVPQDRALHVGSRLCARVDAVAKAIREIQDELRSHRRVNTLSQLTSYHNLYTLYTSLMIAYGVGFRAVVNPFIPSRLIDPETHLAALADKNGADNNKSRLVWVPPSVYAQIQNYEVHRDAMVALLIHKFKTEWLKNNHEDACFFIQQTDRSEKPDDAVEVRPKTLNPYLDKFLPLPPNAQRRLLRNELRERGCPPEVVDAFMGHWSMGEEPWGSFSSYSFRDHLRLLRHYLLPLLEELGWFPIASTLIGKR